MCMHRENTTWAHSEEAAVGKPRRETSREIKPVNNSILDTQTPSELWKKFLLLFLYKPPGLWYFIIAALAD